MTIDEAGAFGGIRNFVGRSPALAMNRSRIVLDDWDYLLVCSDGLPKHVDDDRILELVLELEDPDRIVQGLLNAALAAGGTDNVSVVCVEIC